MRRRQIKKNIKKTVCGQSKWSYRSVDFYNVTLKRHKIYIRPHQSGLVSLSIVRVPRTVDDVFNGYVAVGNVKNYMRGLAIDEVLSGAFDEF